MEVDTEVPQTDTEQWRVGGGGGGRMLSGLILTPTRKLEKTSVIVWLLSKIFKL